MSPSTPPQSPDPPSNISVDLEIVVPIQELEAGVHLQRLNRFELLNDTTDRPRRVFRKTPPPTRSKERERNYVPAQHSNLEAPTQELEAGVDFQRPNRLERLNDTTDRIRRVFRKTPPPPRSKERDAHLPSRRLSLDTFDLRSDVKTLWSNASPPSTQCSSRAGTPSAVTTKARLLCLVQRRRSTTEVSQHHDTFAELNTVSERWRPRSNHSRHGECLAHPSGLSCDCEQVQLPTMDQSAAWHFISLRFKAAHAPAVCGSLSAADRLDRRKSDPFPYHDNRPPMEDLQARERRVGKVLSRLPAMSNRLVVPTRVDTKFKLNAVGRDSCAGAASRYGGAKDALPTRRARLSLLPKTTVGVRKNSL